MSPKGPKPRHVPQRTCIACRQEQGKRTLMRVVRTPDNRVLVDPTGKIAGRGAYICAARQCWDRALQGGRLASALKTQIAPEALVELRAFAESLPVAKADGQESHS